MRVVRLIVEDDHRTAALGDAWDEIFYFLCVRGRLRSEHGRHHVRLIVFGFRALVNLLDIGQVQRALRPGPLAFAAQVALEVPEDAQLFGNHRVVNEDAAAGEVGSQPLEDDDVGSEQEERLCVIVARLGDGVEILPGDGQRDDLRLAAAGRHLDAVAGEVVELQQFQVGAQGERFDERLLAADFGDFVEVNERFDGVALGEVVGETATAGQAAVGEEPVVEEAARGVGGAGVVGGAPGGDLFA